MTLCWVVQGSAERCPCRLRLGTDALKQSWNHDAGLFPERSRVQPSLLLDGPAGELDNQHLAALIGDVSSQSVKLIVTTLYGELPAFAEPGSAIQNESWAR